MGRVSVGTKVFLVAASFALPLAVMIWLMVSGVNGYIAFANQELKGGEYQQELEGVLEAVLNQQAAAVECALSRDCAGVLKDAAGRVEKRFADVKAVDARYGADLQFTPEGLRKRNRERLTVNQVEERWRKISAESAKVAASYTAVVEDLRGMITHAGDTSNLILDPDLDSYYLMDVTLLALPQTQARMGKMNILFAEQNRVPGDREQGAVARAELGLEAAMLQQSDLDRVMTSSATSINEDSNFYGTSPTLAPNLAGPLETYKKASADLIAESNKLAKGAEVSALDYSTANAAAREAAFQYWRAANDELAELLRRRIQAYYSQRSNQLAVAFAAIAFAALLSWWLSTSITRPLKELMRSLGPGATLLGNCAHRISETATAATPDALETEVICEELNAHCDSIQQAVLELARHVEGADAETRESNEVRG
jgi:hypothetical protein